MFTLVDWSERDDGEIVNYYDTYEEAEEGMKTYYELYPDCDLTIE